MEILSLAMQKGIRVYAVKGNWQLNNSIQSKIVAMAFAMAAEIERDLISQRTTEALQARKQQGMPLGRPKNVGKSKLDAYQVEITTLLKNGATKTRPNRLAESLDVLILVKSCAFRLQITRSSQLPCLQASAVFDTQIDTLRALLPKALTSRVGF